jgi:hypothetical protein
MRFFAAAKWAINIGDAMLKDERTEWLPRQ